MKNNELAIIQERVYVHLMETLKDQNLRFLIPYDAEGVNNSKGYWFKSNEASFAIFFWNYGKENVRNILYSILEDGSSFLFFIGSAPDVVDFFAEVSLLLEMEEFEIDKLGRKSWIKKYSGNDYIASLDYFLKIDKKIIDSFIASKGMMEYFPAITKELFEGSKILIAPIRREFKEKKFLQEYIRIKSIYLQALDIENICLFSQSQIVDFNRNITCFIGVNGTGKTSILRALTLAFSGYQQSEYIRTDESGVVFTELSKLLRIEGVGEDGPLYPTTGGHCTLDYYLENGNDEKDFRSNKVKISQSGKRIIIRDSVSSSFSNISDDKFKSLFLVFPQLQGSSKSKSIQPNLKYPNIFDALSMLDNKPDNRFGEFGDWLIHLRNESNDKKVRGDEHPREEQLLVKIFEIISKVTKDEIQLYDIVVKNNQIWVKLGNATNPILFDMVSQGYNNLFGWVGYFMKRLSEVTPEDAEDFTQTPGIVLIDEIDTYLHPQWQSTILSVLLTEFPNVQFVVTTHSPYVVGSIPNDKINIHICHKEGDHVNIEAFNEFNTYGANLERLSEKVFGVNGRFVDDVRQKFERLAELIDKGELSEAKKMLKQELNEIDPEDPELKRSQMLIRTKEILGG